MDQLRGMDGQNISRTFGFKPNLVLRAVKNFYYRNQQQQRPGGVFPREGQQLQQQLPNTNLGMPQPPNMMPQPQLNDRKMNKRQSPQQQFNPQLQNKPQTNPQLPVPNNINQENPTQPAQHQQLVPGVNAGAAAVPVPVPNQPHAKQYSNLAINDPSLLNQPLYFNQMNMYNSDASVYDMYASMGGINFDNLGISSKMPLDEMFLLNAAIIIDKYELRNGNVFILKTFPRYYDKSLLMLLQDNDVPGLAQNLNFWITRATQSFRNGDENLKNALNTYSPNTYFLPIDSALNRFTDRERLNNNSFLFDVLFRSHRVSNRILFDYYMDDKSRGGYFTDTGLPVSTRHKRVNGVEESKTFCFIFKFFALEDD